MPYTQMHIWHPWNFNPPTDVRLEALEFIQDLNFNVETGEHPELTPAQRAYAPTLWIKCTEDCFKDTARVIAMNVYTEKYELN